MKIIETSVFRGPNIYALFPVIRHVVDLGVLEDWPSAKLGSGFVDYFDITTGNQRADVRL